jgi:hypothetical protein
MFGSTSDERLGIMRTVLLAVLSSLLLAACNSPTKQTTTTDDLSGALSKPYRVLILGDSISMGYTPHVREQFAGEAIVVRAMNEKGKNENCAGTKKGIEHVDRWLAMEGGGWDVIHYNFGLHDLKRVMPDTGKNSNDPSHTNQAPLALYEKQLREIAVKLAGTGAKLVFATTTPVPDGGVRPYRDPEDVARYNAVGVRVAEEVGAEMNDLFGFALTGMPGMQKDTDVHFSKEGNVALAERVVAVIRGVLAGG